MVSKLLSWNFISRNRSNLISANDFFDKYNSFNMYISVILVLIGIMSNTVTMRVLFYARKRMPKINCLSCLILLTQANIIQLLAHFYMSTLTRIIYHFGMEKSFIMSVYLFDSNVVVCKLFNYFKFFSRFLALSSILVFSFVRMLAVYYPFKSFKRFEKCLLFILFGVSVLYPLCYLFIYDIVETGNLSNPNSSKNFHVAALTPIFQNVHCSIPIKYEKIFLVIHWISLFFIFVSYFIISLTNVMLIAHDIKLRKQTRTNIRVNRGSKCNNNSSNEIKPSENVFSEFFFVKISFINLLNFSRKVKIISENRSFQNKKMLITLSSSFILFNIPYFCVLFLVLFNLDSFTTRNEEELVNRIRLKSYFTFVEIFKLFNSSITGLLIFVSGKIFRIHFRFYFKESFPF